SAAFGTRIGSSSVLGPLSPAAGSEASCARTEPGGVKIASAAASAAPSNGRPTAFRPAIAPPHPHPAGHHPARGTSAPPRDALDDLGGEKMDRSDHGGGGDCRLSDSG